MLPPNFPVETKVLGFSTWCGKFLQTVRHCLKIRSIAGHLGETKFRLFYSFVSTELSK